MSKQLEKDLEDFLEKHAITDVLQALGELLIIHGKAGDFSNRCDESIGKVLIELSEIRSAVDA